jgi:hypothetical protein
MKDSLGIEILATDDVMVTSYGAGARIADCGIKRPVIRINHGTVVIKDASGDERAINPINLTVLRRDGYRVARVLNAMSLPPLSDRTLEFEGNVCATCRRPLIRKNNNS